MYVGCRGYVVCVGCRGYVVCVGCRGYVVQVAMVMCCIGKQSQFWTGVGVDNFYFQVIVFINSSYKDVDQSSRVAFHLLDAVYKEISKSGGNNTLYVVFGDNMR